MSRLLGTLGVASGEDLAAARQKVLRVAELLGLDRPAQTRIATAASEIARNAVHHAGGGELELAFDDADQPGRLVVTVRDRGPGIADLDAVLSGRHAFAPGHGAGLVNARRLVDEFDIASGPSGTTVTLAQRRGRQAAAGVAPASLQAIAQVLHRRGSDALAALREQDRQLIDSLAELQERQAEAERLSRELEETNRGVVALYAELDDKAEQLRVVSDMKSRFLSYMSHEFRTPLNSILALTRLLLDRVDGELTGEQERQVEYVRRSAQGLLEMVNDLLDLAKVEAGRLEIAARDFSVEELLASLRGSLRPLLTNPAVQLSFEAEPGLPQLRADEQKLAQVLRNLVSNALKFTEQGQVRVQARHDEPRGRVVFTVEDSGIGIPAAEQERIFEEFGQVEGRLQRGGTGLGLPLSRRLAQLMGGDLTVRSAPGRGSTFEFAVPLRFGEGIDGGAAGRSPLLLVVDDEEAFRYVVGHIGADAGFRIAQATHGEEALSRMDAERPDLVVLDLQMPGMDGFALLERLQAPALADVPVIVCTSQRLPAEQKRRLAHAHAIVAKHDISREGLIRLFRSAIHAPDESPTP